MRSARYITVPSSSALIRPAATGGGREKYRKHQLLTEHLWGPREVIVRRTIDRNKVDSIVLEGAGLNIDEMFLKTGDKLSGRGSSRSEDFNSAVIGHECRTGQR